MALQHCLSCTTAYSVGAPKCPHCGSTEFSPERVVRLYACQTRDCGARYRLKVTTCQRCHGTDIKEEITPMAKITVAGGPSNADDPNAEYVTVDEHGPEPVEVVPSDKDNDLSDKADTPPQETGQKPKGDSADKNTDTDDKPGDDKATDYESLTADELRDLLGQRKLAKTGAKAELVDRLKQDDQKPKPKGPKDPA